MEQVSRLSKAVRDWFVAPLEAAVPTLPDDGAHIAELRGMAAKLSDRLLTLSTLCDISRDISKPADERTHILPDMAGDGRLLASTATQTERLATDILLLHHATFTVKETLAGILLPLAVSYSSRLLHYSTIIRFSLDRDQLARVMRAGA